MNSVNKKESSKRNNIKLYSFEGGYISYNPLNRTEKYCYSNEEDLKEK